MFCARVHRVNVQSSVVNTLTFARPLKAFSRERRHNIYTFANERRWEWIIQLAQLVRRIANNPVYIRAREMRKRSLNRPGDH